MPGSRSLLGVGMPGQRSLLGDWWGYTFHVYPQKLSKDDYIFTLILLFLLFNVSVLE